MEHYQIAIIGAGPGGYETAIRLNQFNISVICIEKERIGGVCLNKGCIPTKSLVKVADLYSDIKNAEDYGIKTNETSIDYQSVINRKNQVVEKLVSGIEFLFNKRNIPLLKKNITKIKKTDGKYFIYSSDELLCSSNYIIIATGSKPKELPFLPFDNDKILSSDHILNLNELPKNITIIGGGVIGCEFACIFAQFGVSVSIVEFLPEIVPTEDEEISKRLNISLKKMGIKIFTKTSVESGIINDSEIELSLSNGKMLTSEKVLVSVGRNPVFDITTEGFEINKTRDFIEIDEYCQTNEQNVFAIGDITGKLMLAHTASKQGLLVADYINKAINNTEMSLFPLNYENIPACIFTNPEVSSCGLTEKQARQKYEKIKTGKFPYAANGKALSSGAINGFVKTIINEETNEILGIHIIGYTATELIAQASILLSMKSKVEDVSNIIFAHPTISECMMESIEDTHSMAIHLI